MGREKNQYNKLVRVKSTGFFSFGSLWQGVDHLLLIESRKFSEYYKRFYYNDIQAVVTSKTPTGRTLNAIFASLAGCCAILIIATGNFWIAAGSTSFFLMLLGINILCGPTCQCHIQTAVQTTRLAPVKRLRKARKLIIRLRPLIEAKQGGLDPGRLAAAMASLHAKGQTGIEDRTVRTTHADADRSSVRWLIFQILFALLLLNTGLTAVETMTTNTFITLMEVFVDLAVAILTIICLVRLYIAEVRGLLRPLIWTTLIYNVLRYAAGYVMMMYYAFSGQIDPNNQWRMIQYFSHLSPYDSPYLMAYFLFSLVGSAILGALGLLLVNRRQRIVTGGQQALGRQTATVNG